MTLNFKMFFAPLISITLLSPFAVSAASAVTVLPAKTDISVKPGDKIRNSLMLVNSSSSPISLKVGIKDIRTIDANGKIDFYDANGQSAAKNWLVPQYTIVGLAPLSSLKMDYIVAVPKDMPGRGYAGAILFQLYDPAKKIAGGNVFGSAVAINVMAKGITTGGDLGKFTTPVFQYAGPAQIGFKINNPSNSNISLSGKVILSDMAGRQISEFPLDKLDVYPESSKLFSFSINNSSLLGPYKAEIQLKNIDSSVWFIFLPWQKMLLGFLILLAVIFVAAVLTKVYSLYENRADRTSVA